MMEVVSYGNQIRWGKYKLHSKFTSAVNFCSDDSFVFVVNKEIGKGPLNIVLQGIAVDSVSSLKVGSDGFCLNGNKFCFDKSKFYNSSLEISEYIKENFEHNLKLFESILVELSPPKSLAFLFDDRRKKNFLTSFESEYLKRFETGYKIILSDDYIEGIKSVRGLGPGLTPSGDDFISGVLIALNLLQKIRSANYTQTIKHIHEAARGENHFTNTFLMCAAQGFLFEKLKQLIHSILFYPEESVIENTKQVLASGQTSGADQAVGFLVGLKRF